MPFFDGPVLGYKAWDTWIKCPDMIGRWCDVDCVMCGGGGLVEIQSAYLPLGEI